MPRASVQIWIHVHISVFKSQKSGQKMSRLFSKYYEKNEILFAMLWVMTDLFPMHMHYAMVASCIWCVEAYVCLKEIRVDRFLEGDGTAHMPAVLTNFGPLPKSQSPFHLTPTLFLLLFKWFVLILNVAVFLFTDIYASKQIKQWKLKKGRWHLL